MAGRGTGGANQIYNEFLFGKDGRFARKTNANRQQQIYSMLKRNITELALNRFKWEGFPETVDTRFLEMALLFNGCAVAYNDVDYDKFLVVKANGQGSVNMVDNPVAFTVFGPGSYTQGTNTGDPVMYRSKAIPAYLPMTYDRLSAKKKARVGVPIWPNYLRQPELDTIEIYASRISTIEMTLEINSTNARQNKIIKTTPNTQLSAVNFDRQIAEGVNGIQVSAPIDEVVAVETLDLGIAPESYDKLKALRNSFWNDCMGLLGIDAANQDKKERLVAAEVGANNSQADQMRFVALNARRIAAQQIKEVFGYDIEVDFNVEVEAQAMAMIQQSDNNSGEEK
jgi:hypothetical protein